MSEDVKPLTPTKRTKPYTIKELAALKDAQGPRAESLLDFLGVQATVETLDTALARAKELESELKEAHRQRLEACEGESERAVERDEALKELEEVKARADAAEARVKELEEALAVAFNHTIDKGLTFVARRHEDLGERLWDLAKSLARAAPSTHERARSSGSPPPPRQESEAMSKKPVEPQPNIIDGVPFCSDEDCPLYDGKRCEALGASPGNICEPAVGSMSVALSTHKVKPSGLTLSQEEVAKVRAVAALLVRIMERRVGLSATRADLEAAQESLAILDKVKP